MSVSTSTSPPHHAKRPRQFAPLDPGVEDRHGAMRLRGVVFDVDGTLCLPQNYMFREMRSALGIPKSVDILDHIRSLSDTPDDTTSPPTSSQARAKEAIRSIERTAMAEQRPQPGLVELMAYLTERGVPKALCTRNFHDPVHHLLNAYLPGEKFEPIVTRETEGVQPKPSPEGLWMIARHWKLDSQMVHDGQAGPEGVNGGHDPLEMAKRYLGEGLIMVGDSIDDMAAGHKAGAATVLLVNEENRGLESSEYTDLAVGRLDELVHVLERGFEGKE